MLISTISRQKKAADKIHIIHKLASIKQRAVYIGFLI